MHFSRLAAVVLAAQVFLSAAFSLVARAENWPQWRGERLDGISREKEVPTKWSKTENVLWRLPLPGPAGSTPVVWDDRIYLTSVAGESKAGSGAALRRHGRQAAVAASCHQRQQGRAERRRQFCVAVAVHRRPARVGVVWHGRSGVLHEGRQASLEAQRRRTATAS